MAKMKPRTEPLACVERKIGICRHTWTAWKRIIEEERRQFDTDEYRNLVVATRHCTKCKKREVKAHITDPIPHGLKV